MMLKKETLEKIKDNLENPHWFCMTLGGKYLRWMSDKDYLSFFYRVFLHKKLDWDNPKLFTEKLLWLKLYNQKPEYTDMVDKYEVKRIVSERVGSEYVIPALGVWERFEDIDFSKLPNEFILKTTHDSGGFVVCKDKKTFDYKAAQKKISKRLKRNFYWKGREWPYKNVKPRIIAEPYIDSLGKPDSVEYKLTCFDGVAKLITVCRGIAHSALSYRTNDHYDRDLNPRFWYAYYKNSTEPLTLPKEIYKIIELAEKLSEGIPQVRVDFYLVDGQIYFGEMTFFTWDGFIKFNPKEQDKIMGEWIVLPPKYVETEGLNIRKDKR